MEHEDLIAKLKQIEEHARDVLAEFPKLTRERLRMIIGLAAYLKTEISLSSVRTEALVERATTANDDERLADSA